MKPKPLAQILREAREATGIGQSEAARRVGYLGVGSLWRIEHGQMNPSLEALLKLAELYGVEVRFGDQVVSTEVET